MSDNSSDDILIQTVIDEIHYKQSGLVNHLKLNYAICESDDERNNFTSNKLEETKTILGKFSGDIALFLREAILDGCLFCDDNESLYILTRNFIFQSIDYDEYEKTPTEDLYDVDVFGRISSEDNNSINNFIDAFSQVGVLDDLKTLKDSSEKTLLGSKINPIYWNGNQTEFMELVKALIESESIKDAKIKGKQKELIEALSEVFNIHIKNPDKLLQDIKDNRLNDNKTILLDRLKNGLNSWLDQKTSR